MANDFLDDPKDLNLDEFEESHSAPSKFSKTAAAGNNQTEEAIPDWIDDDVADGAGYGKATGIVTQAARVQASMPTKKIESNAVVADDIVIEDDTPWNIGDEEANKVTDSLTKQGYKDIQIMRQDQYLGGTLVKQGSKRAWIYSKDTKRVKITEAGNLEIIIKGPGSGISEEEGKGVALFPTVKNVTHKDRTRTVQNFPAEPQAITDGYGALSEAPQKGDMLGKTLNKGMEKAKDIFDELTKAPEIKKKIDNKKEDKKKVDDKFKKREKVKESLEKLGFEEFDPMDFRELENSLEDDEPEEDQVKEVLASMGYELKKTAAEQNVGANTLVEDPDAATAPGQEREEAEETEEAEPVAEEPAKPAGTAVIEITQWPDGRKTTKIKEQGIERLSPEQFDAMIDSTLRGPVGSESTTPTDMPTKIVKTQYGESEAPAESQTPEAPNLMTASLINTLVKEAKKDKGYKAKDSLTGLTKEYKRGKEDFERGEQISQKDRNRNWEGDMYAIEQGEKKEEGKKIETRRFKGPMHEGEKPGDDRGRYLDPINKKKDVEKVEDKEEKVEKIFNAVADLIDKQYSRKEIIEKLKGSYKENDIEEAFKKIGAITETAPAPVSPQSLFKDPTKRPVQRPLEPLKPGDRVIVTTTKEVGTVVSKRTLQGKDMKDVYIVRLDKNIGGEEGGEVVYHRSYLRPEKIHPSAEPAQVEKSPEPVMKTALEIVDGLDSEEIPTTAEELDKLARRILAESVVRSQEKNEESVDGALEDDQVVRLKEKKQTIDFQEERKASLEVEATVPGQFSTEPMRKSPSRNPRFDGSNPKLPVKRDRGGIPDADTGLTFTVKTPGTLVEDTPYQSKDYKEQLNTIRDRGNPRKQRGQTMDPATDLMLVEQTASIYQEMINNEITKSDSFNYDLINLKSDVKSIALEAYKFGNVDEYLSKCASVQDRELTSEEKFLMIESAKNDKGTKLIFDLVPAGIKLAFWNKNKELEEGEVLKEISSNLISVEDTNGYERGVEKREDVDGNLVFVEM